MNQPTERPPKPDAAAISATMAWLGRRGGKARTRALTKAQRKAAASVAGAARWDGVGKRARRAHAKLAAAARWAKANMSKDPQPASGGGS
jgi:hypothetical protein